MPFWSIFYRFVNAFNDLLYRFGKRFLTFCLPNRQKIALLRFRVTILGPMLRIFFQNRNTILARPRLGFLGVCYDVTYFCGI